jgi:1,4-alpha-glucan branching enzyme
MIDLGEVGAFPSVGSDGSLHVDFGLYLPGIPASEGYQPVVRIIHRDDRFDPAIAPQDFDLRHQAGHPLDLWRASVRLEAIPGTNFGKPGTYLYRYQLLRIGPSAEAGEAVSLWFTDPFARATDIGDLAAFTVAGNIPDFAWSDAGWQTPELDDLVVYEIQVEEFNDTFDGIIERLPYLKSLGVNALELMPVTSMKLDFDWGYGPLHYFAPNAHWGGVDGLKRLVNACHTGGLAVILDVVSQHVNASFPYKLVYDDSGKISPMIGPSGAYGPTVDFSKTFAQEYFGSANRYWLDEYHVDGFRYDEVTDLYQGPLDTGYAKLAYDTYNHSLGIARFRRPAGGYSRIIQVAEALWRAREVLANTYTSAAWQDDLLNKAEDMAQHRYVDDAFAHVLDPSFPGNPYPATKTVRDAAGYPVEMPVAPFQYIESHDHSGLISFVAELPHDPGDVAFGDRSAYYKLQPFAIALYTCQGVPMLWQGQEFAESWTLPPSGSARIAFRRNVHWEYFYDTPGQTLVGLYRRLGALRREHRSLRSRESYYYYAQSDVSAQTIAYHRRAAPSGSRPEEIAMIFLNFSDRDCRIAVPFPAQGRYREMLDDAFRLSTGTHLDIEVSAAGESHDVLVPSNYGQVFMTV